MSKANKRIPVTEERWRELHDLKEPGQTWDEVIEDLVTEHKERRLAEMVREKREQGDFEKVDPDSW
jgi:predicted CopG family antitoxin